MSVYRNGGVTGEEEKGTVKPITMIVTTREEQRTGESRKVSTTTTPVSSKQECFHNEKFAFLIWVSLSELYGTGDKKGTTTGEVDHMYYFAFDPLPLGVVVTEVDLGRK